MHGVSSDILNTALFEYLNLSSPKATEVHRFCNTNNRKTTPTYAVKLSFSSTQLPDSVIGYTI